MLSFFVSQLAETATFIWNRMMQLVNLNDSVEPPSPFALPIIGHIHLLAKHHKNPWQGFNEIKKAYGDVVSLQLGTTKAVLVSSTDAIREVLITKSDVFLNRPHVYRHTLIFGRDRENSLALCDWSSLHESRRELAHIAIVPRCGSDTYKKLDSSIQMIVKELLVNFDEQTQYPITVDKNSILTLCGDIFIQFLCSKRFPHEEPGYKSSIYGFDYVFYDINKSYAVDFLPFLAYFGLYTRHFNRLENVAISLRDWVEEVIVKPRMREIEVMEGKFKDRDFLDTILKYYMNNNLDMPWNICLFEIGDLIGGQSAVGNLLMRLLGHVATNPEVQEELWQEAARAIDEVPDDVITLKHKELMPLHEASIYETLRIASSPIVPHVARKDTQIQGYSICAGTMVLFNTYYLNISEKLWTNPLQFNPRRFTTKGFPSFVKKPNYFVPFSNGKRACLGYKMVLTIAHTVLANLLLKYKIVPVDEDGRQMIQDHLSPIGCLALSPDDCFKVALVSRSPPKV